jgi:hypothetical protein
VKTLPKIGQFDVIPLCGAQLPYVNKKRRCTVPDLLKFHPEYPSVLFLVERILFVAKFK